MVDREHLQLKRLGARIDILQVPPEPALRLTLGLRARGVGFLALTALALAGNTIMSLGGGFTVKTDAGGDGSKCSSLLHQVLPPECARGVQI